MIQSAALPSNAVNTLVVEASNVDATLGNRRVLRDISFRICARQRWALLGRNGAGKSTLLRVLVRLIRPSKGRVSVFNNASVRLSVQQLRSIGYVSEDQKLPEWMHVWDLLAFLSTFYPTWDHSLARELCDNFSLPQNARIDELSVGMYIKMLLVTSLAYRPKLLLFDEPFASLDEAARDYLTAYLSSLEHESAMVIATHDLACFDTDLITNVAVLSDGALDFEGDLASAMSAARKRVDRRNVLFQGNPPRSVVVGHLLRR